MYISENNSVAILLLLNRRFLNLGNYEPDIADCYKDLISGNSPYDGFHIKCGCHPKKLKNISAYAEDKAGLMRLVGKAKEALDAGYGEVVISEWRHDQSEFRLLFDKGWR